MHTRHQGLFTLWRRVKSFSQELGCRVIDFPDPESQKGFVYLPSPSLSLVHPRLPISFPRHPHHPYLILIPGLWSVLLSFPPSPFRHSLFLLSSGNSRIHLSVRLPHGFLSISLGSQLACRTTPLVPSRPCFHAGVSLSPWSRVESRLDSVLAGRYGRIVKIGH